MDELELYEDGLVIEEDFEEDFEDDLYDDDDVLEAVMEEDDVLEAVMEEDDEYYDAAPEELGEFRGIRRRRQRRKKAKANEQKRKVMTAKGIRANRTSIAKANRNIRRNAIGIRQVNRRVAAANGRISANARVNRIQSMQLRKMARLQKAIGVMEFVEAYNSETNEINTFQLLKGAVASGLLGTGKGGFNNPYMLGAAGLFLNINGGNLGGLLGGSKD